MTEREVQLGAFQKVAGVICIALMLLGLALIPFVQTSIAIGIAGGAVLLYFAIKLLVRKKGP